MSGGSKEDIRTEKARKRAEALRKNLKLRKSQQRERTIDTNGADTNEEKYDSENKRAD